MSEIDWSTAPEGAEFYMPDGKSFYKTESGTVFLSFFDDGHWHQSGWVRADLGGRRFVLRPTEWPTEDRIDVIGQQGNDGLHYDAVNHPKHYQIGAGIEAIDIIESSMSKEQFSGYLLGNFLKYRLRAGDKGDLQQDIDKSNWYRQKLAGQTSKT